MQSHESQELFEIFARREPKLVDEVVPNVLPLGDVLIVRRQLLRESVPIRDLRTIFETLADAGRETKNPFELTERVRQRLARSISARFKDDRGRIAALVLDPRAEEAFRNGGPDAGSAQRVLASLDGAARAFAGVNTPPVLLCEPDVRRAVAEFLSRRIPGLAVLAYREVDPKATVRTLGVVSASRNAPTVLCASALSTSLTTRWAIRAVVRTALRNAMERHRVPSKTAALTTLPSWTSTALDDGR